MPIYNIQVAIDPSSATAGARVVQNVLGSVSSTAKAAQTALQRAFDFNAGPAVNSASAVDRAVDGAKSSIDQLAVSADKAKRSLDVLFAPNIASANNLRAIGADLNRLYGVDLPRNQQKFVNSSGQVRASTLSLGQQFNDFATQVLAGGSVVTAFAQQSGQAAFALQGMNGKAQSVGQFLAGPWGTLIIIGTTILAGFLAKTISLNGELDKKVNKLKADAHETELDRQAHEAFNHTIEGLLESTRKLNDELDRGIRTQQQLENYALNNARRNLGELQRQRDQLAIDIATKQGELDSARSNAPNDESASSYNAGLAQLEDRLTAMRLQQSALDTAINNSQRGVREAQIPLLERGVTDATNGVTAATDRYTAALGRLRAERAQGLLSESKYQQALLAQTRIRDAAILAAQEQQRLERTTGVITFGSPTTGGFGNQSSGYGVRTHNGRSEFHPGVDLARPAGSPVYATAPGEVSFAGQRGSYGNLVIINSGGGTEERFGHLSRILAQHGVSVSAGDLIGYSGGARGAEGAGNSTGPHLHYEVRRNGHTVDPTTGRYPVDAGSAEDAAARAAETAATRAAREAEQQHDFIQQIVDQQAQRGQAPANSTQAQIDRVLADFRRRFNRAPTTGANSETARVTGAITEAQARETAQHFQTAYVDPLVRLQALQGTTGIARQVLNTQLEETQQRGRELLPIEKAQIENSIRQGDALQRENDILTQIRQPLQDYQDRITALNALLARGSITQGQYNTQVAALGSQARTLIADLPGRDPNTGQNYGDIAARANEDARYETERQSFIDNQAQLLALGINYDALMEAAHQRHVDNLNQIDRARQTVALTAAQQTADSLASIAEASAGKQSAIYKVLFATSKAFAIAESIIAIQQGIAKALSLPFPANLAAVATVAAAAASIISNIQAVALNLADGGYVDGPGSSRSDSIPANLSKGEYVVNAQATRANRALLDAINSGRRPAIAVSSDSPGGDRAGSGSGDIHVQVGDIHVNSPSGDGRTVGMEVKKAIVGVVRQELTAQMRDGGKLTRAKTSVMSGA